jgi:hypothetical protein
MRLPVELHNCRVGAWVSEPRLRLRIIRARKAYQLAWCRSPFAPTWVLRIGLYRHCESRRLADALIIPLDCQRGAEREPRP